MSYKKLLILSESIRGRQLAGRIKEMIEQMPKDTVYVHNTNISSVRAREVNTRVVYIKSGV